MQGRNRLAFVTMAMAAFALASITMVQAVPSQLNLSGYEFLLGSSCTIDGIPGTCGVEFGGWTGGSGPGANGWTRFPGNRRGLWAATINYTGSANFGSTVIVTSGSFDVLFKQGRTISGVVTGGTVIWPIDENTDAGCGAGVANVALTLSGGASSFAGCLHDLPAGTVIPPTIWGTLF